MRKIFQLIVLLAVCASIGVQASQKCPESDPERSMIPEEVEKKVKGIVTDTIFIHHTEWKPNASWRFLSDAQKKRLYGSWLFSWFRPTPHSGHYRMVNGRQVEVFYAYHWIVRSDGRVERLLNDDEVGWHSGCRDDNLRSVAIVFDGDFRKHPPSDKALRSAAMLIREYTESNPQIVHLKAHHDVCGKECPGSWFYVKDKRGRTGRQKLLALAKVDLF